MDGQGTARWLVCAIAKVAVLGWLTIRLAELCRELCAAAAEFLTTDTGPADSHQFECRWKNLCGNWVGRLLNGVSIRWSRRKWKRCRSTFRISIHSYRRLKQKSSHANVLTRFGNITLTRATYRQGSRGRTIAPLEIALGIE